MTDAKSAAPWPWGPWRIAGQTGHACQSGECDHEPIAEEDQVGAMS